MEYRINPERVSKAKKIITEKSRIMDVAQLQVMMECIEMDHKVEWAGQGSDLRPRFHLTDLEIVIVAAAMVAVCEEDLTLIDGEAGPSLPMAEAAMAGSMVAAGGAWDGARRGGDIDMDQIPF